MIEFLHPIAWWLLLFAVPVTLFYLLKNRARRATISTTLFWEVVIEEHRLRSFWRQFRHIFSLLLSLCFVAILVAAVLNPVISSRKKEVQTVIVFDCSASMSVVDTKSNRTRFDEAKKTLRKIIETGGAGQQTAIITTGGVPQIAVGFTNHLGTLRKTVESILPTDTEAPLGEAIELARLLTDNRHESQSPRIVVITDGCSPDMGRFLNADDLAFFGVGEPVDNVALTRFQPRRSFDDAIGYEVLIEVANFGETEIECQAEIDLNGNIIDVIPFSLKPNQSHQQVVRYSEQGGGVLRATLKGLNANDALTSDNTAWAILPSKPVQHILFYGNDDFFLTQVLASQLNVELTRVTTVPESLPENSVLIVHQTVPEKLPSGCVFIVDPQNACEQFDLGETLESPYVGKTASNSPLLQSVRLENTLLRGAKKLTFNADMTPASVLLETPDGDPLYLQCANCNKTLVLTADVRQSELALRTAFPILFARALTFFRGEGGEWEQACKTGQTLALPLSELSDLSNGASLQLRLPDGSKKAIVVENGMAMIPELLNVGVYEIVTDNAKPLKQIACNLAAPNESNLRLTPELPASLPNSQMQRAAVAWPIWFWLAVIGLFFTVGEWHLFQRRWID